MSAKPANKTYAPDEIIARLRRDLPYRRYDKGAIRRVYRTNSWKGTMMALNAVGHLAEAAWHHPDIRASYERFEVALNTHEADGVTDKDFELARKIEDVVGWRPGAEGGALEGTPADERHAYIKYDD